MMKPAFPSGSPMVTREDASIDCIKIDIARDEICHYEAYNMEDAQYGIVSSWWYSSYSV